VPIAYAIVSFWETSSLGRVDVLSDAVTAARAGLPTSYRVECRPPWGRQYQPVPGAGLHVILEGSCWLIDPTGPPVALGVGDILFLPHGDRHGIADQPGTPLLPMIDGPDQILWQEQRRPTDPHTVRIGPDGVAHNGPVTVMLCGMYRFARERPHPLIRDLPDVVHLPARLGQHHQLRTTIDLLATELGASRPGTRAAVTAILDLLLVHMLRAWYDGSPNIGWGAALTDPVVGAALRAIHDDPSRQWTVEDLGALAGMSRAAFARRFKRLAGQGPLTYLTWWRMTLAARLLRESDAPLAAVGHQIGYGSEFAFANAFKRQYGVSPGRYRDCRQNMMAA
jgi:AraC-like DNA-binding protein